MLEVIELNGVKSVKTDSPTHHVYVVDVSLSMGRVLPKMKEHLKNVISLVTKPSDTFTIIYFSGKGQCGIVCESVEVSNVTQLTVLKDSVDRWLNVIGLTGFVDPLDLAMSVSTRDDGRHANFVMLTDGYDNTSSRSEVLYKAEKLPEFFDSCSFIEFGWYCDRQLISAMAERTGGIHMFSEGYMDYESHLESAITKANRVPMQEVSVNKKAKHAVYVNNGQIIITEPTEGKIRVPETVDRVHAVMPRDVMVKNLSQDQLYVVLYYAAKTNDSKLVWNCLEKLGDVKIVNQYSNAFSRQELTEFTESVASIVLGDAPAMEEGQDFSYVPDANAYTIVDLLNDLDCVESPIYLYNAALNYNRVGAKREAEESLPKFVSKNSSRTLITGIVFNANRANVSIQVKEEGTVRLPENDFGETFVESHRTKNYTVIRDGIVNIDELPLVVPESVVDMIGCERDAIEIISGPEDGYVAIMVNLRKIPVINRSMIEEVDLNFFKEVVTRSQDVAAKQKVAKHFKPLDKSQGMTDKHGEEFAKWLSDLGIRDYGFSPKGTTKKDEDGDCYIAHELKYQIKGLSSLPSINAVQKKLDAEKKLTVSESLIAKHMNGGKIDTKEAIEEKRRLNRLMSQFVYAIVVGKAWFKGYEDRSLEVPVEVNGYDTKLKVSLEEKQISL